jgi:hypothetical protein
LAQKKPDTDNKEAKNEILNENVDPLQSNLL